MVADKQTSQWAVVTGEPKTEAEKLAVYLPLSPEAMSARAEGIVERMMAAFDVRFKTELAAIVDCDSKKPGKWIGKGKVPDYAVLICHYKTGASLDWLYDGKTFDSKARDAFEAKILDGLCTSNDMGLIALTESNGFDATAKLLTKTLLKQLDLTIDDDGKGK
ncbi:MAG: hypothetical protein ACI8WB_001579 [Phenylobacterium sp.]|jgi:hypothetical protein